MLPSSCASFARALAVLLCALGPTPLPIRLRAALVQVGIGVVDLSLRVAVAPATAIVNPTHAGCAPAALFAYPVFEGSGVGFSVLTVDPIVLVLGLGVQPLLVPSPFPGPCLLLPSPDLLVPIIVPQTFWSLPLPAAVRPVTVWAQGVLVTAAGLGTTDGFSILAQ